MIAKREMKGTLLAGPPGGDRLGACSLKPVTTIMTGRMLLGIKQRAEAEVSTSRASSSRRG